MDQEFALLFVYGTLKRGLVHHHQLGDAVFVGEAVMPGVDLHDLGPFPMAVAGAGTAHGELYRVEAGRLAHLDRFEGVPRLYRRECLPLSDGRQAWIYLGSARQVRHSPRLPAGCWPAARLARPTPSAWLPPPAVVAAQPVAVPGADGAWRAGGERPRWPGCMARRDDPQHPVSCRPECSSGAARLVRQADTPQWPGLRSEMGPPVARWGRLVALLGLLLLPSPQPAGAEASLALCQRWQRSSGLERILMGNAIGAASYLTKVRRLAESDPEHPQLLYAPADLQRACDGWR